MSGSREGYVFDGVDGALELQRLHTIESIFDPDTVKMLRQASPLAGARCLEVGAGAGSIARWLFAEVGPSGSVDAVDLDVRFLADLPRDIRVTNGDVTTLDLRQRSFDLIHARFVLIHNEAIAPLLDTLVDHLDDGGYLALEEPDFASAHAFVACAEQQQAFHDVNRAIQTVFAERGQRFDFGRELPATLHERGLKLVSVDCDCPVARGGSPMARMMAMSTSQLGPKYLATGRVNQEQLDRYAEFTNDPTAWALYHGTVRVLAQKPRAS